MKTFKQFIKENWMYHGTDREIKGSLRRNQHASSLHDALGVHMAADHEVSHVFAVGDRRKGRYDENPHPAIFRFKRPPRSKLHTIKQDVSDFDSSAVDRHVIHTVMSHPEGKEHFIDHVHNRIGYSKQEAEHIHKTLSMGKPYREDRYDHVHNNIKGFLNFHDAHAHYNAYNTPKIVDTYHKIMKQRGIHGLVYRNTDRIETQHIRQDGRRGSTKTYIMFPHSGVVK